MTAKHFYDILWREILLLKKRVAVISTGGGSGGGAITALTGPVTATGPGSVASTITNNAVGDAQLRDSAALSVIGRPTNSSGDPSDIAAGSDHQVMRRSGTSIGWGAVNLAQSAAVTGLLPLANLAARTATLGYTIGDGSTVITTGVKGFLSIPVACTILSWRILSIDPAVTSGSIVVDIWKDTYANHPPTDGDSITASAPPTVTTDTKAESSSLTGWGTSISAGDVLGFNVDSITAFKQVLVQLTVSVP